MMFKFFKPRHTAPVARDRLKVLLAHERAFLGKPDLIAVLRDLRPEREAELARAQLLGRQHQTQKLEAIGRLAGGIAADVNNVLASILGYADLALEDLPPDSKGRESVEQVLKAGRPLSPASPSIVRRFTRGDDKNKEGFRPC